MLRSEIGWRDIQASAAMKLTKKQRLSKKAPLAIMIQLSTPMVGVS
jgi:hypothetical protein